MAHRNLEELVRLSRFLGSDRDVILVGGGNTSLKTDTQIYIKASGKSLEGITGDDFVLLDRDRVRAILCRRDFSSDVFEREAQIKEMLSDARIDQTSVLRASVETSLHELIPYTYVVHTHPNVVTGLTCSALGRETAEKVFGKTLLWIDYTDPGYTLAKKVEEAIKIYRSVQGASPKVILLQNHGLFVGADTPQEAKNLHAQYIKCIKQEIDKHIPEAPFGGRKHEALDAQDRLIQVIAPTVRRIWSAPSESCIVHYNGSKVVMDFVCSNNGHALAMQGALAPDEIVYCKAKPVWVEYDPKTESEAQLVRRLENKIRQYRRNHHYDPKVVLVEGIGLFAVGEDLQSAQHASLVYEDSVKVRRYAEAFGGARSLSKRAQDFIETWEVESYRRKIAQSEKRGLRYENKIAVVTGASQGLGQGIALGLAEQGMYVVAVDINEEGAREVARIIEKKYGPGRAIGVKADVTRTGQVEEMVDQTVKTYGGIDVLISNAGILKAHKLTEFPEEEWKAIINVNLVGYFICAKAVAQVMQYQKDGDIIQTNSKSGKKGSKYNSAYATSKFGGIGLTQSIALDLIEDGIRVNAVCPGNLFDLPLWSGDGGLFDQYKAKLGVRTREEVRQHYESQIPMGRGCEVSDILRTIFYILDQKYETGQAYNVTGGQEMR